MNSSSSNKKGAVGKRASSVPDINSNLKACLIFILHKYSSAEKPLQVSELKAYLDKLSSIEKSNTTTVTIRKNLDDLWRFSNDPTYIALFKQVYGGTLIKCHLDPGSTRSHHKYIIDRGHDIEDSAKNSKIFYYFESQFTAQELFMLLSSIQTNPYFSVEEINGLKNKMISVTSPDLFMHACSSNQPHDCLYFDSKSARLLKNVAQLLNFIHQEIQIEINYGKYCLSGGPASQDKFDLTPTRVTSTGVPKWQRIDPIATFQANGFYYLVAHTDKSSKFDDVIAYRIDRIIDMRPYKGNIGSKPLKLSDEIIKFRNNFSYIEYQKSHPVMYAGNKSDIFMLVLESDSFSPVNSVIDTFGRNVSIRPATDSDVLPHLGKTVKELEREHERWYVVHLYHSISGSILWAKQHIDNVLITSPQEAIDQIKAEVSLGLSRY